MLQKAQFEKELKAMNNRLKEQHPKTEDFFPAASASKQESDLRKKLKNKTET